MQINHFHTTPHQLSAPKSSAMQGNSSGVLSTGNSPDARGVQRTEEDVLAGLLRSVREDNAVRPDVVALAKAKLDRGEYSTRLAADAAATNLLQEFLPDHGGSSSSSM
ncbi:MAG: hypothetical protein KDA90_02460 [Planctomycetaceae bacterium]|nr:hypothetical protein [Planctomycetaceae bacterium]